MVIWVGLEVLENRLYPTPGVSQVVGELTEFEAGQSDCFGVA